MSTHETPQRRSRITHPELCSFHDKAMELARTYCPRSVSDEALQEGGLKWWSRLSAGRVPEYLFDRRDPSRLSPEFLSYWILRSARNAQQRMWARERRKAESGYTLVAVGPESDTGEIIDSTIVPVAERVASIVDAERAAAGLSGLDPVVELRAEGFSPAEVAAELGLTVENVRVRDHRGRRGARGRLAALGEHGL